jgi:hypothetical protein
MKEADLGFVKHAIYFIVYVLEMDGNLNSYRP